jgi:F420-dependent oxidoreductase-like protein
MQRRTEPDAVEDVPGRLRDPPDRLLDGVHTALVADGSDRQTPPVRVALMIEGQEGVTWEQWCALADACEEHGVDTLFRSDHYISQADELGNVAHDAWTTIAALAARTSTLRFGTLVSPATFRLPSLLANAAATADHVSGGRIELGLGAGWMEREHRAFGFPFPETRVRTAMLAEQLEIVHGLWRPGPFVFKGRHHQLEGFEPTGPLPKPVQQPHPPIILGGHGGPRSAALAAQWADEYNTVYATADLCQQRRATVEKAFEDEGRDPGELTFSLMTGCVVGANQSDVDRRIRAVSERTGRDWTKGDTSALVMGTVDQAVRKLKAFEEAGVDRVMLQHLVHEDLDMVHLIGQEIVPAVA